jgi:hypothetical protein
MSHSIYEPHPTCERYRFRHSATVIPKLPKRTATADFCDDRSWSMLAAFFNAAALPDYSFGKQRNLSEGILRKRNDHPSIAVGM